MSVTAAKGFRASGVAAGLKSGGGLDVALVVNDGPDATVAGVFTTNRVKAAPVQWSQQVLRGGVLRAVVLNSGGANACTGSPGFQDTHATAERAAARLSAGRAGRLLLNWGEAGDEPGEFWLPNSIVISPENQIYIADTYNHRIQVFRFTGKE